MSNPELISSFEDFADLLESGRYEFYSRHQEEEWGCRFEHPYYIKWNRNYLENKFSEEILSRNELFKLFGNYKLVHLKRGLRKRDGDPE
jgi:hypothetical protein